MKKGSLGLTLFYSIITLVFISFLLYGYRFVTDALEEKPIEIKYQAVKNKIDENIFALSYMQTPVEGKNIAELIEYWYRTDKEKDKIIEITDEIVGKVYGQKRCWKLTVHESGLIYNDRKEKSIENKDCLNGDSPFFSIQMPSLEGVPLTVAIV